MSFIVTDDRTGQHLTADQPETELCKIILDAELAEEHWEQLGDIGWWLPVLALMANP